MAVSYKIQVGHPQVRPIPFPFENALAISNDPDLMTPDYFDYIMPYLCERGTHHDLGLSLGLNIDTGYFAYATSTNAIALLTMSEGRLESHPLRGKFEEYLQQGLLQSVHTLGDHDEGFTSQRSISRHAVEQVFSSGGDFTIWTNHGNANNIQCIGPEGPHHQGDLPGSTAYSTDLWVDSTTYQFYTSSHLACEGPLLTTLTSFRNFRKPRRLRGVMIGTRRAPKLFLQNIDLRDGGSLWGFSRFRGTGVDPPHLSNLDHQLRTITKHFEVSRFECAVLYQHFGVVGRKGKEPMVADRNFARLNQKFLRPLIFLSELVREGRIWNPSLRQLLHYNLFIRELVPNFATNGNTFVIELPVEILSRFQHEVCDVSIYVPDHLQIACYAGSRSIPVTLNAPDDVGRRSITVNLRDCVKNT